MYVMTILMNPRCSLQRIDSRLDINTIAPKNRMDDITGFLAPHFFRYVGCMLLVLELKKTFDTLIEHLQ